MEAIDTAGQTKAGLEKQLDDQKQQKEEVHMQEKELAKRSKSVSKEYEATGKEMQEAKEKFATCERKDIKCREDLKHNKGKQKKLVAAIAKLLLLFHTFQPVQLRNTWVIWRMRTCKRDSQKQDSHLLTTQFVQAIHICLNKLHYWFMSPRRDDRWNRIIALNCDAALSAVLSTF